MRVAAIALLVALAGVASSQDAPPPPKAGHDLIDGQVKAKLADLNLKAAPAASDAEFLRRAFLDIVGSIPSLDHAEKFLADKSSDKRAKLVDALLASDAYAANWSYVWAGTFAGATGDGPFADAVIYAVSKQLKPHFDKNEPISEVAKAVVTYTGKFERENMRPGQMMEGYDDGGIALMYFRWQQSAGRDLPMFLANKFSRAFLGMQISCAQCHDHPFDKWTQEDFYGMAAFFTEVAVRPIRKEGVQQPIGYEVLENKMLGKVRGLQIPDSKKGRVKPQWLDTKEEPKSGEAMRAEFTRLLTSRANTQFARAIVNKYWAHFFGRGIVNPPDDFNGRNKPSHPEMLEGLAAEFIAKNYDVKWLVREICASQAYQTSSRVKERTTDQEKYYATASVRALTPEQIMASLITATLKDPSSVSLQKKGQYLKDFRFNFGDDEDAELTEFEGTIPQALMMMNSELIARGTGGAPASGGTLRDRLRERREGKAGATRLDEILDTRKGAEERVRAIFLTTLTRQPTAKELSRYVKYASSRGEDGFEDVMWTLLNTSEFLFNH